MGRQRRGNDLDEKVKEWLLSKGFAISYVRPDYVVTRSDGFTTITITLYADDFMAEEPPPPSTIDYPPAWMPDTDR